MLVGSPELAQRLKLPVAIDLRGRFETYAEAMAWLWTTYKDRLNPRLCDFRHPALLPFCTFDYGYQWRALMFWIAGPKEEHLPGVDRAAHAAEAAANAGARSHEDSHRPRPLRR